ncbi:hypothetical protein MGYG_00965 [Nannizzia gypsea CBS 118893]|uniref:Uncharacterized protein n=1 Tax=Arthroderma gypseum (strain ATCC MYA-4604 / CBS 118893) TaxID=535722 RepID=E5R3B3_ARTGP|nr:hypothetical protein MGYG_00965 [Nannizzia gypsea CBS 118893]EFQ97928.1 hypothetical protein MGYG_00965 [Nannizzia gypsea CBS 118893]
MVVFIDHSLEGAPPCEPAGGFFHVRDIPPPSFAKDGQFMPATSLPQLRIDDPATKAEIADKTEPEGGRDPSRLNGIISMALSCYPIVTMLARSVDLTTLHSLSMTCRQVHSTLLIFRNQLVKETLRCRNEIIDSIIGQSCSGPSNIEWGALPTSRNGSLTWGKAGRCARDMVDKCQRCDEYVCRNCTVKPPSLANLKNRLRRICRVCIEAPLSDHKDGLSAIGLTSGLHICACDTNSWYCRPCGQHLRCEDVTYQRVWSWRSRYNEVLGGGDHWVGFGDCGQGVQCGLEQRCLAAEYIEVEVDCEAGDWVSEFSRSDNSNDSSIEHPRHSSSFSHSDGRDDEEPGYLRQEIEGIGGVVKQKVKKRVRVGASVEERDDDRETATYLKQETSGAVRSRCGWCSGIVPSNVEKEHN